MIRGAFSPTSDAGLTIRQVQGPAVFAAARGLLGMPAIADLSNVKVLTLVSMKSSHAGHAAIKVILVYNLSVLNTLPVCL